jgi:hypothetical protein
VIASVAGLFVCVLPRASVGKSVFSASRSSFQYWSSTWGLCRNPATVSRDYESLQDGSLTSGTKEYIFEHVPIVFKQGYLGEFQRPRVCWLACLKIVWLGRQRLAPDHQQAVLYDVSQLRTGRRVPIEVLRPKSTIMMTCCGLYDDTRSTCKSVR